MPHYVNNWCGCEVVGDGSEERPYEVHHNASVCQVMWANNRSGPFEGEDWATDDDMVVCEMVGDEPE